MESIKNYISKLLETSGKDELSEIIMKLLESEGDYSKPLFTAADFTRKSQFGEKVDLRGLIEFSNYCYENCINCELSEENYSLKRYRMSPDEIIEAARKISNSGVYSIILQAGYDSDIDSEIISYLVYSIKQQMDVSVTLSFGMRGFEEYRTWKIAGADRYILRNEKIKGSDSFKEKYLRYDDRVYHLKYLKRLGYKTGTYDIINKNDMPLQQITEDILTIHELGLETVLYDTFIPDDLCSDAAFCEKNLNLVLNTIAVTRLLMNNSQISAGYTLDRLAERGREEALKCGANFIMPDFTPKQYLNLNTDNNSAYYTPERLIDIPSLQKRVEAIGRKVNASKIETE